MIDWQKHYREVYATEINRLKQKDVVGFAFDGPSYVPTPEGMKPGWHMMLTLKHNKLLGQPDIGVHIPVIGMTPPDDIIRKGAEYLLENAREERYRMESPVESGDSSAVIIPGQQHLNPLLPPGLAPKGTQGTISRHAQPSEAGFKATAVGRKAELPSETQSAEETPSHDEDSSVTDSESGAFKIVDKRKVHR